jgi:hypothetical protein
LANIDEYVLALTVSLRNVVWRFIGIPVLLISIIAILIDAPYGALFLSVNFLSFCALVARVGVSIKKKRESILGGEKSYPDDLGKRVKTSN